jgi:putative phosphoesterase
MKVAIVSDTHGVLDPRVKEAIQGADAIVHAGDIVGKHVLDELGELTDRVVAVRGNNDVPAKWKRDLRALKKLPMIAELELPGGTLVIEHGDKLMPASKRHEKLRKKHERARAIVVGHSHHRAIDRDAEPWILNPGAAGRDRTHGGPSCLILDATARRWRVEARRFSK